MSDKVCVCATSLKSQIIELQDKLAKLENQNLNQLEKLQMISALLSITSQDLKKAHELISKAFTTGMENRNG